MRRKNDGTTHGGMKQTGRNSLPQETARLLGSVKEEPTLVQDRRCWDTRRDTSADRWRGGAPRGIETMHGGNRDMTQGKQDKGPSGEVGKTGVQGEGETRDQLARGEKDEGEMMINLDARIMKLDEQAQWDVQQDGGNGGIQ